MRELHALVRESDVLYIRFDIIYGIAERSFDIEANLNARSLLMTQFRIFPQKILFGVTGHIYIHSVSFS